MKNFILISASILLIGCVPQTKYDQLLEENKTFIEQLDECQNGEQRLIGKIEKCYNEKNYSSARINIVQLLERHPHTSKFDHYKNLLVEIERKEAEIQKQKELDEKERLRLENLNNTGMWEVTYFVDDFGDKTDEGYFRNKNDIYGTFSNSATQDSRLRVRFLISNPWDFKKEGLNISIMMFEYAGSNPIKDGGAYDLFIEDSEGERHKLRASNDSSDRMRFNAYSFRREETMNKKMHKIFMKGGKVRFVIKEDNDYGTPSEYKFTIDNADYYENAVRKLLETK